MPDPELTASPALYPIAIDHWIDAVQFVRMSREQYTEANFLDRRMLRPDTSTLWRSWPAIRDAVAGLPVRCHFIFHISHVGSTLLSRLMGSHPALFSLREPAILRTLAEAHLKLGQPSCPWSRAEFDTRVNAFLALWSRTFDPNHTSLIKATSFVSEMAEDLLRRVPDARAICMHVSPQVFLPALLGGAMIDIDSNAATRLARLRGRLGDQSWTLKSLSPGERVAMSWLTEMLAVRSAAAAFPGRVLWIDFDEFLSEPDRGLTGALRHLGLPGSNAEAAAMLAGPAMHRYSKQPERRYDAETRGELLQAAMRAHAAEIARGLKWLEESAATFPAAAEVVRFRGQSGSR